LLGQGWEQPSNYYTEINTVSQNLEFLPTPKKGFSRFEGIQAQKHVKRKTSWQLATSTVHDQARIELL
jgi:hypothetical protein